jgi:ribonuclease PH
LRHYTHSGRFLEIQGTAEKSSFTNEQVTAIIFMAEEALGPAHTAQLTAIDGQTAEASVLAFALY